MRNSSQSVPISLPFAGASTAPKLARAPGNPAYRAPSLRSAEAIATDNERTAEETRLERLLSRDLPTGRTLSVRLTDNRYTMVMVRRGPSGYVLRLHRMFAVADGPLLQAIARYVASNDARASAVIGAFIAKHQHTIPKLPQRQRRVILRTAGRFYDLQALFERLNREYFAGALQAQITWGSAPRRLQARRSIKMGSFAVEDRLIRIHPVLDDRDVPEYFVAWIVFHEMLHGKFEVVRKGERRCFHSKEFLAEERTFREYDRASAWERANMDRLLGPSQAESGPAVRGAGACSG